MERALPFVVAVWALLAGCREKEAIQPSARYGAAAAVVEGRVFIVGGRERSGTTESTAGTTEVYDPSTRKWFPCAAMPTPRSFAAAAAFGGKVFVFGGLDPAGKALATVEAYDPRADSWSACPPMGTALARLAAVTRGDRGILVAGGMDAAGETSGRGRLFLPSAGTWRDWPELPSGRHGLSLVDAGDGTDRILAVGGHAEEGPVAAVDVFSPGPDGRGGQEWSWRPGPPLAAPRGYFGLAVVGRRVYLAGGRRPTIPPTEFLDLDALAAGWKKAAPMPRDLCRFAMVEWKGHLLAFGGETGSGVAINGDVFEYDPAADRWAAR